METMTVTIEKTVESATVRNDGFTDVLYRRVIRNAESSEVIVRDVVRELLESAAVAEEIARLSKATPAPQE